MSTRLRKLLEDLLEDPKSMVSLVEVHDRRTITSAEKKGLVMIYSPQMAMLTDAGKAYLTLGEDHESPYTSPWAP